MSKIENEKAVFTIVDEVTKEKIEIEVSVGPYGLRIEPKGYGHGEYCVALDFFSSERHPDDALSILVYADPDNEDASHRISLRDVKNTNERHDKRRSNDTMAREYGIVDEFIRFLKDEHCFDEYKQAVEDGMPHDAAGIDPIVYLKASELSPDGYIEDGSLFWHEPEDDIDWENKDDKWKKYLELKNKVME